jgi:toxin ParE1/3/4
MTIILTNPAYEDLESIRDYIKKDSEYYANAFIDKMFDAITNLKYYPKIGRIVPEF